MKRAMFMIVLAIQAASPATAQDQAPDPANQTATLIAVRATPAMPDTALRFLARVGVTTSVDAPPASDAIALLKRKCGNDRNVLRDAMRTLTPGMDRDLLVPPSGKVTLPACPYFEQNVTVRPVKDTNVSVLIRRATGFEGDETLRAFRGANPALQTSSDPNIVTSGTNVVLPYRSAWTAIDLKPGVDLTTADAINNLKTLVAAGSGEKAAATNLAHASTEGAILPAVPRGTLLDTESACVVPTSTSWPFDAAALVAALRRNSVIAAAAGVKQADVGVAILDSNFAEPPAPPFIESRIVASGLLGSPSFYGVNAASQDGAPLAMSGVENADHGTMVATLALGGRAFLEADSQSSSRVHLRMSSVIEITSPTAGPKGLPTRVTEGAVVYGMTDALSNDANIINMSFAFSKRTRAIEDGIGKNPRLLAIVAAGNLKEDLAEQTSWPASFGGYAGDLASRVITVGASDAASIADFSARGANQVDILAPGCAVPTTGFDLRAREATGTSFAAPLVAFTAALIRQLGVVSPQEIKRRILVSSDVRPELRGLVWSVGILNPVKAIELFSDRIEADGAAPLLGAVRWNPVEKWTCKEDGAKFNLSRIAKIARLGPAGASDWLVIRRNAVGSLEKCTVDLRGASLEIVAPNGDIQTILTKDIIDLVARQPASG